MDIAGWWRSALLQFRIRARGYHQRPIGFGQDVRFFRFRCLEKGHEFSIERRVLLAERRVASDSLSSGLVGRMWSRRRLLLLRSG